MSISSSYSKTYVHNADEFLKICTSTCNYVRHTRVRGTMYDILGTMYDILGPFSMPCF